MKTAPMFQPHFFSVLHLQHSPGLDLLRRVPDDGQRPQDGGPHIRQFGLPIFCPLQVLQPL